MIAVLNGGYRIACSAAWISRFGNFHVDHNDDVDNINDTSLPLCEFAQGNEQVLTVLFWSPGLS